MTERERMLAGLAYWAGEDSLVGARRRARRLMARINQTLPEQEEERQALFRELLGKTGDAFYIELRLSVTMAARSLWEKTFMQILNA